MQRDKSGYGSLHVLVVGGSITGLMTGILLKRAGHDVTVIEQSFASDRTGQAAGIGLSKQIRQFFSQNDRTNNVDMGILSENVVVMQADMTVTKQVPVTQQLTTWDTIYYRLRANFDYYKSDYCPDPPVPLSNEGIGTFKTGKRMIRVELDANGKPIAHVRNLDNDEVEMCSADYVVGADGVNSTLRRNLLPGLPRSEFGYCIWRGTVPVSQLSEDARKVFQGRTIVYQLFNSYAVIYIIPGPEGSLANESRELNFAWYLRYSSDAELKEILTDTEGHVHRTTLPKGKMRPEIWETILQLARRAMHPIVVSVVEKIRMPFVSVVSSIAPPRASFMDHRVFLIGDALYQLQPNSGQGSNMAAFGAKTLTEAIHKAASTGSGAERRRLFCDWEYKILDRGGVERIRSVIWAHAFLQNNFQVAMWSLRLLAYTGSIRVTKWWRWLLGLGGDGEDGYMGA